MTNHQVQRRRPLPAVFTVICCGSAVGIGGVVLVGWTIDFSPLKSVLPGRVAMNPVTAICFILSGASLYFLRRPLQGSPQRRLACLTAIGVTTVGAVKIAAYFLDWDPGIDRLFFRTQLGSNEIAPNTAVNFLLFGLALLCIDYRTRGGWWPAQGMAMLVGIGSILSLIGYAFGARILYGVPTAIPMALNTATVFHLLALALLASRPERGLAGLILGSSAGGALARRLVPAAVAVPALIGWLRHAGQQHGFYDGELGVALMVAGTIVSLLLLTLWTADTVNRMDAGRRQAEASLRESESRFRLLVDSVQDYAIFMLDPLGRVATWNLGAQRIKGYTADEIIGQHISCFFPGGARRVSDLELQRAATEGRFEEEAWRQRKDGTRFWASVIITPVRNADGQLTGFAKVTRDITQRRNAEQAIQELTQGLERRVAERTAELAESNRQLRQQNEENETFVYSVSHDLRSPLVNLQGFSKELEESCGDIRELLATDDVAPAVRQRALTILDDGMTDSIRFIQTAVTRLSTIIDALLRLSRAGRVEYHPVPVAIDRVVQRVIDSLRATMVAREAHITVHDLHPVVADPTSVEQIFANLVGNALNYLDPQRPGDIHIGVDRMDAVDPANDSPGMVTFFVRDNGCGIPDAHRAKIFRAFQRLRPELAQGEGMGLAIVRRMVERHGGRIWLRSTENVGTTFFFTLPAANAGCTDQRDERDRTDNEGVLCLMNR